MQAWLAGLLSMILEKLGSQLLNDFIAWVKVQWAKLQRSKAQDESAKKVEADQGKPRDAETRKDEMDDLNS